MQCNSCGLHSDNLREYSRVVDLGKHRKTIDTMHLCGACRVLNVLNPKYVANRLGSESSSSIFAGHARVDQQAQTPAAAIAEV